jgi:ABC-type hemin transport system substrate-binding protein
VLAERGVSFQRTTTWKQSTDPEFERKKVLFFASTGAGRAAAAGSASTPSGRSR